jgi:dihydrofolate reductase
MSRTGLIGREGGLPWRLPRDLRNFRRLTWGKPIIMGRKTHQALSRPLPGRTNIVLTHQVDFDAPGCLVAVNRDQAIARAEDAGCEETMVIGGSQVYREFLPLCETIHLTLVKGEFEGDAFFPVPVIGSPDWIRIHEEHWPADAANPHHATYMIMMPARSRAARGPTPGPTITGS